MEPLTCIPLLGWDVKDSLQELQGQPCFFLSQSETTHTFSCDGLDVKQSWLIALKIAVKRRMLADELSSVPTSGPDGDDAS